MPLLQLGNDIVKLAIILSDNQVIVIRVVSIKDHIVIGAILASAIIDLHVH